jgi:hypothetical protein
MKIHLLKSSEVDPGLFTRVVDLLQSVPGPIQFGFEEDAVIDFDRDELFVKHIPDAEDFETAHSMASYKLEEVSELRFPIERHTASWETLFKKCDRYRKQKKIPANEFVLLLTDKPNDANWFASLDPKMPYNGFVHTGDWDYYIDCSPAFPVAYEVVALMLQKHIFNGVTELRTAVHRRPIGCVSDLCMEKKEIILKLRTADICAECHRQLREKLTPPQIHHALGIMGSLREKMLFAQNFRQSVPLSKLLINRRNGIFLPDFGNIEIKLRPLEKALYFLFLDHPEGIGMSDLCNFRGDLYALYARISNTGDMMEMRQRIDDMVNVLSDSASQKISRIKRVFEEAIGKDLAAHYYIRGESARPKAIGFDRDLLVFES